MLFAVLAEGHATGCVEVEVANVRACPVRRKCLAVCELRFRRLADAARDAAAAAEVVRH